MHAHRQARRATPGDSYLVTNIMTLAFSDDPLWSWVFERPDGRTDHHRAFWRLYVEGALRYRESWITAGGEATTLWIPPGGTDLTTEQEDRLGDLVVQFLGPKADRYFELFARLESAHPRDVDHYFLTLCGTHPNYRGHGIGMSLLAHDLERIDAEHLPAYLESSNPENNKRYASVGFEPCAEVVAPAGGPAVTTMWRPASKGS
jgi:GNAT superfamily N-acetyltransferase